MKCIVSLSGGRDSSTCLGLAVEKYGKENVSAIGFEYGSKHPMELERAQKIADYYGVPYKIVNIDPSIFDGSTCTMLKGSKEEVEKGRSYEEILREKEGKVSTYVPARNTLFSAYTLAFAESLSEKNGGEQVSIMLGQHADDSGYYIDENGKEHLDDTKAAYPDCSVSFVNAFAKVATISSVGKVIYETPFIKMHKWELLKLGMELKNPVPYEICFSCYDPVQNEKGEWVECSLCATCIDVKKNTDKALDVIEKENPSLYETVKKYRM